MSEYFQELLLNSNKRNLESHNIVFNNKMGGF